MDVNRIPKSIELVGTPQAPEFRYIDERLLPARLEIARTCDWRQVIQAIKVLAVRGAPALGISGAAALALWAASSDSLDGMDDVAEKIATARPTAVNLRWGVQRALACARQAERGDDAELPISAQKQEGQIACVQGALFALVREMQEEDERANRAIGAHGAKLLGNKVRILTHCNAGSLGTYFFGTALGIVYVAAEQGKVERVFVDETRPVGQGARLTIWELSRAGVPATLICDNMAASLMAQGQVDAVIVGADRIALNGDTANKIGTYGVAILAREHGIPFYVAAPHSTIDTTLRDGSGIVIEQRPSSEVLPQPVPGVEVWNPAFDVTPARLITKIITETGAFSPDELASRV